MGWGRGFMGGCGGGRGMGRGRGPAGGFGPFCGVGTSPAPEAWVDRRISCLQQEIARLESLKSGTEASR